MKHRILSMLAICLVAGCTNPVNLYTADRYYQLGRQAEVQGDLETACMYFSRSYGNTVMGNAPPLGRAHALYEYARVSGYLGRLAEAEKGFNEVIVLLSTVPDDPTHLRAPTLSEHAKLLYANGRYEASIPVFEKAIDALDGLAVEKDHPGEMAAFLTNYAKALRAIGNSNRAETVEKRVARIRAGHPHDSPEAGERKYILADEIPPPSPDVTPLTNNRK